MHDDEDENGGGNTSSSQPDNIGVANEDDGNDVDVVKQWGIRHGEAEQVPTGPKVDVPRTPPDDVKTWLRQNASGMPPEMMPKDYTTAANQYQAQFVAEQLEQMEAQPTGLQPSMWAVDVKKAGTVVHSATGATKKAAKHAARLGDSQDEPIPISVDVLVARGAQIRHVEREAVDVCDTPGRSAPQAAGKVFLVNN